MWLYTLVMCLAIAAGILLSRISQRSLPLKGIERFGVGLGAFCGAMLGAKLPFVLSDWSGFVSGAAWFSDGKTILLGMAGGYLGVEIAKWCLDIKTRTGDSFAVPVAVAVSIGRIGCFVGGCCYGTPTDLPWGVVFPQVDSLSRHPTQMYESMFHLIVAGLMAIGIRRGWCQGQWFKIYIMIYATYRFVTEYVRPEARLWGSLTAYQWASLCLLLCFGWLWYHDVVIRSEAAGSNKTVPRE
ncbi:MAG: prolipoprotein diacylglyceryl transferase family protein [Pirellulales bacterium]